jgi:hypothetical protein
MIKVEVVYSQQALSTAVQQTQIQMFIVFGFILVIYILLNVFFIPYYTKQFKAGMFKHDFLNDVGDRKMYSDLGEKRKPSDVLYRMTGFLGKKKIPHLDPTRWDQGTGVKWGPIPVVRFFAVGKAYPKVVPKMLAAEANLAVAQTPIDEDEVKRIEVYKNVHSGGLDKLKEALKVKEKPAWKEEYKSEIITPGY